MILAARGCNCSAGQAGEQFAQQVCHRRRFRNQSAIAFRRVTAYNAAIAVKQEVGESVDLSETPTGQRSGPSDDFRRRRAASSLVSPIYAAQNAVAPALLKS
jgi:pyocin large subunit-like protein